jgi:hypothetical protein
METIEETIRLWERNHGWHPISLEIGNILGVELFSELRRGPNGKFIQFPLLIETLGGKVIRKEVSEETRAILKENEAIK